MAELKQDNAGLMPTVAASGSDESKRGEDGSASQPDISTMRGFPSQGELPVTGMMARLPTAAALGLAIVALALLAAPRHGQAQQSDLSQQMQMFNSMTPDQQQAIMQKLSNGGSGLGGMGLGNSSSLNSLTGGGLLGGGAPNGSQAMLLQQLQLQQQRRLASMLQDQTEQPVFKPGDTVLVEITLYADRPADADFPVNQNNGQNGQTNQLNPLSQLGQGNQLNQANRNGNNQNNSGVNTANLSNSQRSLLGLDNSMNGQRIQEQPQRSIEEVQEDEKTKLKEMIDEIRARNPYELDSNGQLQLPGIPGMAIAGLTEDLATRRAAAEPAFGKLWIRLTRLPLDKAGTDALKPFGYELFDNSLLGLLPTLNMPVPDDYVMGPGDVLQLQLYGSDNQSLTLTVGRDGKLSIPKLGPIAVGGQRYSSVKSDLESRVARQMIGVHANVSMGETRTINVFVLGGAKYPGSYTVSGLATVTTALFAAGGVQAMGSLRSIQVKRQGQTIRTFDLYDLLMRGDSANDIKLLSGDVVFIPPVGPTAALDGEVQRPAIYELKRNDSVGNLVDMGGGLTPKADHSAAALIRVNAQQQRIVINVNPANAEGASLPLRNGDALHVARLTPQIDSGVIIQGYVYRSKYVAWHEGLRISEVIPTVDELKRDADQHYLLIRRELPPNRTIAVLSADLVAALRSPGTAADVTLMPRDVITVFDLQTSREHVIESLMGDLRVQADLGQPTPIVHVDGRVKVPGDYPLEPGMRVSDLLRAGGSLDSAAYGIHAELTRYTVDNRGRRDTQVIPVDLASIRAGDQSADVPLQPFDRLSIKQVSGWTEQDQVTLKGEVRFPGTYSIQPGETLHSVVDRAGGLTRFAFVEGALFTRTELKMREQEQLDRLAVRLRTEIAEVALMGVRAQQGAAPSAITVGDSLLQQLSEAKAVGRLVVDLKAVLHTNPGSSDDVILRNGDELIVPKQRQEVMVLGEVQDPTSHLYKRRMTRDDYIDQSGGPTRQADRGRIYVVRANGSVDSGSRGWFHGGDSVDIHPGDAIIVPLDTERLPALTVWTAVTTILYQLAIAAAEIHATLP
jgi:protein involved in polysaccharide export with SLBB domain